MLWSPKICICIYSLGGKYVLFSPTSHCLHGPALGLRRHELCSCQSYFSDVWPWDKHFCFCLLLPLPLSVYSRSRQFCCALHNGASRCYCNVNSVSTGAIKVEYGFYYPVTRSPLGERIAALWRHCPMAASWLYNDVISNSEEYWRLSQAGWVCNTM